MFLSQCERGGVPWKAISGKSGHRFCQRGVPARESTVKNHTSELYKKLGINSRVELFKIFGVDENADE